MGERENRRATEQAQRRVSKKQREATKAQLALAQQQQKDLRRQKDHLKRMERATRDVETTLRRASRLGAGSILAGPKPGRVSTASKKVRAVPSRATIRQATRAVDQQMRQALDAERQARRELREG